MSRQPSFTYSEWPEEITDEITEPALNDPDQDDIDGQVFYQSEYQEQTENQLQSLESSTDSMSESVDQLTLAVKPVGLQERYVTEYYHGFFVDGNYMCPSKCFRHDAHVKRKWQLTQYCK